MAIAVLVAIRICVSAAMKSMTVQQHVGLVSLLMISVTAMIFVSIVCIVPWAFAATYTRNRASFDVVHDEIIATSAVTFLVDIACIASAIVMILHVTNPIEYIRLCIEIVGASVAFAYINIVISKIHQIPMNFMTTSKVARFFAKYTATDMAVAFAIVTVWNSAIDFLGDVTWLSALQFSAMSYVGMLASVVMTYSTICEVAVVT
jgi:hypothetical protein